MLAGDVHGCGRVGKHYQVGSGGGEGVGELRARVVGAGPRQKEDVKRQEDDTEGLVLCHEDLESI